jgi:hypothetical protein
MVHSLVPGINNIEKTYQSPMSIGKGSIVGGMHPMPFSTRYDANKATFHSKPQYMNTARGLSTTQSMQQLPDAHSIRDDKAGSFSSRGRGSILQESARNNLQL